MCYPSMVILTRQEDIKEIFTSLPANYNFEISKSIRLIKKYEAKRIGLQFPDGLLKYSLKIAKIFQQYCRVYILGDVVYGACCINDKYDFLIHYGHSCIKPIESKVQYVFVGIKFDTSHLLEVIKKNFKGQKIYLTGTIQYNPAVHEIDRALKEDKKDENSVISIVPQSKPLSQGEILGCTAPLLPRNSICIYIGDGRFHLEALMITNKESTFYKYCPFSKIITVEEYDYSSLCRPKVEGKSYGLIYSDLGRQLNPKIFNGILEFLKKHKKNVFLFYFQNEIKFDVLLKYNFIDVFVQCNCPRLSIDWGHCLPKPLLNPFDVLGDGNLVMDFYNNETPAPWKN